MPRLIALIGLPRAGKDVLARHLVEKHAYQRCNFGDFLKNFFEPFTQRRIDAHELEVRLSGCLYSDRSEEDLKHFMATFAEVYAALPDARPISAFTEDEAEKRLIRPLLQYGGELIHHWALQQYEAQLVSLLRSGVSVVTTRVCYPEDQPGEHQLLHRLGATFYEVRRENWETNSAWERESLERLRAAPINIVVVHNSARTPQDWAYASGVYAGVMSESASQATL